MAFSADSLFLAASSNTETVHIFKLEKKDDRLVRCAPFFVARENTSEAAWALNKKP